MEAFSFGIQKLRHFTDLNKQLKLTAQIKEKLLVSSHSKTLTSLSQDQANNKQNLKMTLKLH